jgi:hypothetical protein
MSWRVVGAGRRALVAALLGVLVSGPVASADPGCCLPCPCWYKWCAEGGPRIHIKCGCPKPICPPCSLEHYGYFEPCWRPWPFPPDWSHCPAGSYAGHLEAQGFGMPGAGMNPSEGGRITPEQTLPTPRREGI